MLKLVATDAGRFGILQGTPHGADPRLGPGDGMGTGAPAMVRVLGDIGEMREIGEGSHDEQRFARRQSPENLGQGGAVLGIAALVEADGRSPDLLDAIEDAVTLLIADRVAEDRAEQADIVPERAVLVGELLEFRKLGGFRLHGRHGLTLPVSLRRLDAAVKAPNPLYNRPAGFAIGSPLRGLDTPATADRSRAKSPRRAGWRP